MNRARGPGLARLQLGPVAIELEERPAPRPKKEKRRSVADKVWEIETGLTRVH